MSTRQWQWNTSVAHSTRGEILFVVAATTQNYRRLLEVDKETVLPAVFLRFSSSRILWVLFSYRKRDSRTDLDLGSDIMINYKPHGHEIHCTSSSAETAAKSNYLGTLWQNPIEARFLPHLLAVWRYCYYYYSTTHEWNRNEGSLSIPFGLFCSVLFWCLHRVRDHSNLMQM